MPDDAEIDEGTGEVISLEPDYEGQQEADATEIPIEEGMTANDLDNMTEEQIDDWLNDLLGI